MKRYPNVKKIKISVVRKLNKARGGHFFDRDTMQRVGSSVGRYAYQSLGGDYFFVSCEAKIPYDENCRKYAYTVRLMPRNEAHAIKTVGKYQQWTNSRDATLQAILEANTTSMFDAL